MPEPIRSLGEYDVAIRLMVEVTTNVHVVVLKEGEKYVPGGAEEESAEENVEASAEAETAETVEAAEAAEVSADEAMADMVAEAIEAVEAVETSATDET